MLHDAPFFWCDEETLYELDALPRLASWERSDHPTQVALRASLDHAWSMISQRLQAESGPWAMTLHLGLPESVDLTHEHDLDNYAFPLARGLASRTERPVIAVLATKEHGSSSFIGIGRAEPVVLPYDDEVTTTLRTSASTESTAYKQEIADHLEAFPELRDGPVQLRLAFWVGRSRNWLNLWKPTIDALGGILGPSDRPDPWSPDDGRIGLLGLSCHTDAQMGNDVIIAISASTVDDRAWDAD